MADRTFEFHEGWQEAIKDLPDNVRLELYDAIIGYAFGDGCDGLTSIAKIAFNFIKPTLDEDKERRERIAERNRINGSKSKGRPRVRHEETTEKIADSVETQENPAKPKETQENPNNPVGFLGSQKKPTPPITPL